MEANNLEVQRVAGVWGGRYYMVPRSRIPVFMIANALGWGGEAEVHEMYPHLDAQQLEASYRFIREESEKVEADRQLYKQDQEEALSLARREGTPITDAEGRVLGYQILHGEKGEEASLDP